jgi:hypothetical protein
VAVILSDNETDRQTDMAKFIVAFRGVKASKKRPSGYGGARWHSWLGHCATSRKVTGSIPDGVILITLPAAIWPPAVDSASNRSEYQVSPGC